MQTFTTRFIILLLCLTSLIFARRSKDPKEAFFEIAKDQVEELIDEEQVYYNYDSIYVRLKRTNRMIIEAQDYLLDMTGSLDLVKEDRDAIDILLAQEDRKKKERKLIEKHRNNIMAITLKKMGFNDAKKQNLTLASIKMAQVIKNYAILMHTGKELSKELKKYGRFTTRYADIVTLMILIDVLPEGLENATELTMTLLEIMEDNEVEIPMPEQEVVTK